ncbi:MAG TPA: hypothetical protein VJU87_07700 [Gemmatimonadaceae bacterium]|nr:hypothetical protein [Gemmatimonadaceae bacterium]
MNVVRGAADRTPAQSDSDALVLGGNILSLLAAMGAFRRTGEQILASRGIQDISPEKWYPLRQYCDALTTIEQKMGPNTLFRIGTEIPNFIPLPPGLDTFEAVLGSFAPAFSMNHRGAGAGGITHSQSGPHEGRIVSGTPYPCDFDRGVIQGFFRKLLGPGYVFEHEPGSCKKNGGPQCAHRVLRPKTL